MHVETHEFRHDTSTLPEHGSMYILRFSSYKSAEEHRASLVNALSSQTRGWQWIERDNEAYKLPTDFGLLRIDQSDFNAVEQHLLAVPGVKDLHVDKRITRTLHADETDLFKVHKRPGRFSTPFPDGLDDDSSSSVGGAGQRRMRRSLQRAQESVTGMLKAGELHSMGFSGKGVKVGVFDTGIRKDHEHIRNIRDRTNWTHQNSRSDGLGHGTFVAGVIASQDENGCPGFAPDAELYTFKVFTDDQVSYTSWFMDAFNYAVYKKVSIVNLSIGGPDFMDEPFVDKVLEVTSNGIIMVSAIGNDGPLYGTLNNPADQNDVIGVGGIDWYDEMASFSSRGMSTWELPLGYGRVKPDVVAYGKDVSGSRMQGGCRSLSGTSVASPVVAGAICLLASTVPEDVRWQLLNPASMKQALVEGAVRLPKIHLYEQGSGRINLINSQEILSTYKLRASIVPSTLFLDDCPYMWPFCTQPLYATAMPTVFNATILNAMGVAGRLDNPPVFTPTDEGGKLLRLQFSYSDVLWPWSGHLAVYVWVDEEGKGYEGVASGNVTFTVVSEPGLGETEPRRSTVVWPVRAKIIPTPAREKRVLWDQFHSVKYPPMYLPRDNLEVKSDILDWHGDHPHTNYHDMFNKLRENGYFMEILSSPFTCFDAKHYGALMLVDSEEEYYPAEVDKLAKDVREQGLALLLFGEWYSVASMMKMHFFDDNTRSWWTPVTGGANVPALNDLLEPFGLALGDAILQGSIDIANTQVTISSGANIIRSPAGSRLLFSKSIADATSDKGKGAKPSEGYAVFGLTPAGKGHVAVLGDSNCLDSSHMNSDCFDFLLKLLRETVEGKDEGVASGGEEQEQAYKLDVKPPQRRTDINFTYVSHVLQNPITCYPNSHCSFHSCKAGAVVGSASVPKPGATDPPATPSAPSGDPPGKPAKQGGEEEATSGPAPQATGTATTDGSGPTDSGPTGSVPTDGSGSGEKGAPASKGGGTDSAADPAGKGSGTGGEAQAGQGGRAPSGPDPGSTGADTTTTQGTQGEPSTAAPSKDASMDGRSSGGSGQAATQPAGSTPGGKGDSAAEPSSGSGAGSGADSGAGSARSTPGSGTLGTAASTGQPVASSGGAQEAPVVKGEGDVKLADQQEQADRTAWALAMQYTVQVGQFVVVGGVVLLVLLWRFRRRVVGPVNGRGSSPV